MPDHSHIRGTWTAHLPGLAGENGVEVLVTAWSDGTFEVAGKVPSLLTWSVWSPPVQLRPDHSGAA